VKGDVRRFEQDIKKKKKREKLPGGIKKCLASKRRRKGIVHCLAKNTESFFAGRGGTALTG